MWGDAFRCCAAAVLVGGAALAAEPSGPSAKAPDAGVKRATEPAPAAPRGDAPAIPTPEEAKKVIEYHFRGKGLGPVLAELRPCLKIDSKEGSPTKSDCAEWLTGPVKKNTLVYAWMLWLLPDGDLYDDVLVQYFHEGTLRSTHDLKLGGAFRIRAWRAAPATRAGNWQIKVIRGTTELGHAAFQVQ